MLDNTDPVFVLDLLCWITLILCLQNIRLTFQDLAKFKTIIIVYRAKSDDFMVK